MAINGRGTRGVPGTERASAGIGSPVARGVAAVLPWAVTSGGEPLSDMTCVVSLLVNIFGCPGTMARGTLFRSLILAVGRTATGVSDAILRGTGRGLCPGVLHPLAHESTGTGPRHVA